MIKTKTVHERYEIMLRETPKAHTTPKLTNPIIIADALNKTYKRHGQLVKALSDVSLVILPGEFIVITGASGSGKSTLLQLIGGLDKPTSGTIIINEVHLDTMNDRVLSHFRNQMIGFIFQFFYLQPFLNLLRNIEVATMPTKMNRRERKRRISILAEQIGITDRLGHLPRELSGGEIQRAAIARALVNQPKIILADEPTGNLDFQNSHEIIALLQRVRAEFGTTIVIASHDLEIANQADRVITLQDGELV